MRTPAHLRYALDHPDTDDTDALILGRAVHCLILDGESCYDHRFAVGPCDHRGRKDWKDWLADVPSDMDALRPMDDAQARAMAESIMHHPAARALLEAADSHEVSMLWEHDGVPCKARPDALVPSIGAVVDVKTTIDAGPDAFMRAIWNFGYHRQAAHYMPGVRSLRWEYDWEYYAIIALEKEPPYLVAVYELRDDAIAAGETQLAPLRQRWAECMRTGHWPGYPAGSTQISLPPWAWAAIDEMEAR
jgi:hypothetical protein